MGADDPNTLATVEFEVYGQVQDEQICFNTAGDDYNRNKILGKLYYCLPSLSNYRFCWIANGRIFLRKDEGAKYILVKNESTLLQLRGCYFTKYCKELAEQLGVGGWVKNSKKGTIVGKLHGTKAKLDHMINWLGTTGSPGCKIEKCDLTNWQYVTRIAYTDFSIRF